jgi:hypothetical protein
MCMRPLISLLIPCLVLLVAARAAELPTTATSDQAEAIRSINAFAIELYGQLRRQTGNLFFSPESISTSLPSSLSSHLTKWLSPLFRKEEKKLSSTPPARTRSVLALSFSTATRDCTHRLWA